LCPIFELKYELQKLLTAALLSVSSMRIEALATTAFLPGASSASGGSSADANAWLAQFNQQQLLAAYMNPELASMNNMNMNQAAGLHNAASLLQPLQIRVRAIYLEHVT
jgi:hypothetical protein